MARSVWKGPFVDGYLLNKAEAARGSGRNEIIKIWSRRSTILPQFVGLTFGVYNGHKFLPVQVNENMVGPQVRRVLADPHLHRPLRRQEGEAGLSMSKPKHPRGLADNEAQAILSQPARQPAQAEPGGGADPQPAGAAGGGDADLLQAAHRQGGEKALESAIANAENNHQLDVDRLVVTRAEVGRSIVMRRFHARGRGRVVARREVVQPSEDRGDRARAQDPRRPHRMGHKVNPIGLRLGINRTWDSRWFAGADYSKLLHEDLKLREPSAQQAARRRRLPRGDRAAGEEAARDDLCGAAGRGDRQEGPGHRGAEARTSARWRRPKWR